MFRLFLATALLLLSGCGWFGQLASSSDNALAAGASKRTAALDKSAELKIHDLTSRLNKVQAEQAEAEKEIARLEEELALDGRAPVAGQGRGVAGHGIVRAASLRGRSPLRRLAEAHDVLEYDDSLTACRLAKPLAFEPGGTRLTPQSQWLLNDFSKLLATDDAIDFRVVLIGRGHVGRNGAGQGGHASPQVTTVARYLTDEGLAARRLGILTTGGDGSTVDVFLLGSDRITVGWDSGIARR